MLLERTHCSICSAHCHKPQENSKPRPKCCAISSWSCTIWCYSRSWFKLLVRVCVCCLENFGWRQFKCFYFENTCKTISAKDPLQFVESVKVNLCVFSQVSFFCQHVYICGYKFRAKNIWDFNLMIPKCGLFVRSAFCHELQRNYF